ncbi:MAG TPA: hypothetical protein VJ739_09660 [Gemmataceae bacterium]|nr:hypothetical protein [Gemmataceae bacterium]
MATTGQAPPEQLREPGDDTPEKSWVKHANVITDPEAGVKMHFDYENHKAVITFDEKPTPEMLALVKPIMQPARFKWDTESDPVGWARKINFASREDERRESKKVFYAVANAVRQHKGLPARSFGETLGF